MRETRDNPNASPFDRFSVNMSLAIRNKLKAQAHTPNV